MATATNTKTTAAPAKKSAPAPQAAASTAASTKKATGSAKAKAEAVQAPLYMVGSFVPVRPGTHRHYAQEIATKLGKAKPKGFTLLEFRTALIDGEAASTVAAPRGGWKAHNMPTWMANPNQQWLVPVAAK